MINQSKQKRDPEFDSPEALAKWRTRNVTPLGARRAAYLKLREELEGGQSKTPASGPKMRESEIEAGIQSDYEASLKKPTAKPGK